MASDEIVAIDGPSGSGKSTIACRVAERLGFLYIDTGAMYRAAALRATREGISPDDDAAIRAMCATLSIHLEPKGRDLRVMLDGRDVSRAIRTPEMSLAASRYSALPAVREAMVRLQRTMGGEGRVVMEGRDIGTVVFPGARYKFFLNATDEVRARRRFDELRRAKMGNATYDEVLADLRTRDRADAERAHSPLRRSDDAVEVDTSPLTIEQVVEVCLEHIHGRRAEA